MIDGGLRSGRRNTHHRGQDTGREHKRNARHNITPSTRIPPHEP
jgi:hypothetical protein